MRALIAKVEPYLTPLLAFAGLYFVSLIAVSLLLAEAGVARSNLALHHLGSLVAAIVATGLCVLWLERGSFSVGVFVSMQRAAKGLLRGLLVGLAVVCLTDLIILVTSSYRHEPGLGLNWRIVFVLILPAAFGEELVFRGYVLQKLYGANRSWAVLVTSVLFALAHSGNPSMGLLAFTNILLAGILLALMWAWDGSLWMPTWGHFAWNVMSGPVLGHELSGLTLGPTVFREYDPGPSWLTGGDFGIEGSVVLTLVEIASILLLVGRIRSRDRALAQGAPESVITTPPDMASGTSANQSNDEVEVP